MAFFLRPGKICDWGYGAEQNGLLCNCAHLQHITIPHVFVGERGLSQKASLFRGEFIRLVDKAVKEYREARKVFLDEVAEHGRHLRFYLFTDHIETCINAASRLFKLLEGIRSEKEAPNFSRELRRLVEKHGEFVKDVRNTVEHMDERSQRVELFNYGITPCCA